MGKTFPHTDFTPGSSINANFHARDFCMSGAPCITIDGALCIIIDSGQCTFLLEKIHKVNNVEK